MQQGRSSEKLNRSEYLRHEEGALTICGRRISYMSICAVAVMVSLIVLMLTCFAAVTYHSAEQKLQQARAAQERSSEYYAAESTASQIIASFYKERRQTSANINGRITYTAQQGDIEVTKIDNTIYFSIPIGNDQSLNVEARVSGNGTQIKKWQLTEE